MGTTKTEKIENIKKEIEQLLNRQKRLIQEQKIQERKDRTKRLCRRAGLLESLLPKTITLTEEQFKIFFEKVLLSDSTRRILTAAAESATAAPSQNTGAALRSAASTPAKPAEAEQDEGTDGGE
jgi:TolA-binding protein